MPAPDRIYRAPTGAAGPATTDPEALRADAVEVLTGPDLAHVVDLVVSVLPDGDTVEVANAGGRCVFSRSRPQDGHRRVAGHDPLADQDPLHRADAAAERADPHPPNARNAYPLACLRLASVFADPRAPDVVVVHTGAHTWPERGGHPGEHGSLSAVQSRAPLVVSGHGVSARGVLPGHARVVDVGPTLARLAGAEMTGVDGRALAELAAPGARHVAGLLWDGASCSSVLEGAAQGWLPAVRRLLDRGCGLRGGAVAEFPSVTLVNHTSALTGLAPGRHGILNNAFYDRELGRQLVPNESASWHRACEWLRPGVETLWEAVARARPDAVTACVDDPIDRGATYSTFQLVRASGSGTGAAGLRSALPDPTVDPHASQEWVEKDPDYAWSSAVDGLGLRQVLDLYDAPGGPPALLWWNTLLTDTGHHGGGPHSAEARAALSDADRRLGVFLDRLDALGLADDTTILLTADHGSEAGHPDCHGDWDSALRAAGIPFRDEAYGFLYLGANVAS